MRHRAKLQWCTALAVTVVVAVVAVAFGGPTRPRPTATAAAHVAAAPLATLVDAPGMPTCAPPTIPAATYPPGNTYGVPFLAAITNGQVLAGYDEWIANHLRWKVQGTTYNLDPWD